MRFLAVFMGGLVDGEALITSIVQGRTASFESPYLRSAKIAGNIQSSLNSPCRHAITTFCHGE